VASGAKRKTTMANLNREAKVRDKKLRKQARKEQRKAEAAAGISPEERWPTVEQER
jgi:lambda repressor-like predicted transcriptional regulator